MERARELLKQLLLDQGDDAQAQLRDRLSALGISPTEVDTLLAPTSHGRSIDHGTAELTLNEALSQLRRRNASHDATLEAVQSLRDELQRQSQRSAWQSWMFFGLGFVASVGVSWVFWLLGAPG
jgi:DNA-binding transcriptional MerR regulator